MTSGPSASPPGAVRRFSSPQLARVHALSAATVASSARAKELELAPFVSSLLDYIESSNAQINAVTFVAREEALARARELDARAPLEHEFLFGVPVLLKENIQKRGFPVECASRILQGYKGHFDATAVRHLEAAGAIIIGMTNMDEFAMGSSNEHSAHGPVRNPWDLSRVSGGSSGGPGAAAAVGYAPLTLGSDTGGSVRLPAAYCGVHGFKPSYGRVSRSGLVAYGSSLDQIGPFARRVEDLELCLRAIGREDAADATSLKGRFEPLADAPALEGLVCAVPRALLSHDGGLSPVVRDAFATLESRLKNEGVRIVDVDLPELEHTLSVYYVIASAEASSNLARFDGIRYGHRAAHAESLADLYRRSRTEGFGAEVRRRIMLGTFALSSGYYDAYYGKAQLVRRDLARAFDRLFAQADFFLLPTAPTPAFRIGENEDDPLKMYLNDVFTIPANLAGLCALSSPAPRPASVSSGDAADLPVGLQLMGRVGDDARLLRVARALEHKGLIGCEPPQ